MKKNILNIYIYIIIFIIMGLIVIISPINNIYLTSVAFICFTIFLMTNYFNNNKCIYRRELYILWILIAVLIVIFTFNVLNTILIVFLGILLLMQIKKVSNIKKDKVIKEEIKTEEVKLSRTTVNVDLPSNFKEEEFYQLAKKLYIDMQKYFASFNYDRLKEILNEELYYQFEKQMNNLEKSGRVAVRDNIDIVDFKIIKFEENINNLLITVNMGVLEDKYTLRNNEAKKINCRYETYYEITFKKSNDWTIDTLNLINSRSKKS